jgi:hypothetical protein
LELVGSVDAAYGTDPELRCSVNVVCLAGGAVAYKSKLQGIIAVSSPEAEFIAAVHVAKVTKYLRSVLSEHGLTALGPM